MSTRTDLATRRDGEIVFYSLTDIGVELLLGVLETTTASQAASGVARSANVPGLRYKK